MDKTTDLLTLRREKIDACRANGIDPYPNDFDVTHTVAAVRERIDTANADLANDGQRVLGVAFRRMSNPAQEMDEAELERDMTFVGLVGMMAGTARADDADPHRLSRRHHRYPPPALLGDREAP